MNLNDFKKLLENGEAQWLEWKADFHFGLIQGKVIDGKRNLNRDLGKAEVLKALISLANSSGDNPAYLVYGVEDLGCRRDVKGISKPFDDAYFQEWAKCIFDPPPTFHYERLLYEKPEETEKPVGIFTIKKTPDYPHVVKENIGGILHKGQVWFRTGSQNGVALREDLEKMFKGEEPVRFKNLSDPRLEQIKKSYKGQGKECPFESLAEKEKFLCLGYKEAYYPGTRQGIVVGNGMQAELVMLVKPREEK